MCGERKKDAERGRRLVQNAGLMGVDLPPRAPAKAAKARQRSSVTPAQRLAAEDAAIKAKEPTRKAKRDRKLRPGRADSTLHQAAA